jgi:solute carrier family 25 phosphate transporter 3
MYVDWIAVDDVSVVIFVGRSQLTVLSYDSFKIFMGLPTTGGGPAAEKKQ